MEHQDMPERERLEQLVANLRHQLDQAEAKLADRDPPAAAIRREDGMLHVLFPEQNTPEIRSQLRALARRAVREAHVLEDGTLQCPHCARILPGDDEFEGHALIEFCMLARKQHRDGL